MDGTPIIASKDTGITGLWISPKSVISEEFTILGLSKTHYSEDLDTGLIQTLNGGNKSG